MFIKPDHPLYAYVLPHLGETMKTLDSFVPKALAEIGLKHSRPQWFTLREIGSHGPLTNQELSHRMRRDKGAVKRMLDTLERKGLVEFSKSKTDQRVKLVGLSQKGSQLLQESIEPMKRIASVVETNLTQTEKEELIRLLAKVRTNVESYTNEFNNKT